MCLPALKTLDNYFQPESFIVLASPAGEQIFSSQSFVDRVIVYKQQFSLKRQLLTIRQISAIQAGLAVIFPCSFYTALLPFLGGVRQRVGVAAEGRGIMLTRRQPGFAGDYFENYPASPPMVVKSTDLKNVPGIHHLCFSNLALLEGLVPRGQWLTDFSIEVPPVEMDNAAIFLRKNGLDPAVQKILGLNPGTADILSRRYPPEHYARIGDMALKKGLHVLLFHGPGEKPLADTIRHLMKGPALLIPKNTRVMEMAAYIKHCACFITGDTGPMHMAAAVGPKVIGLFGPTHPAGTFPFSDGNVIVSAYADCAPCSKAACKDRCCFDKITPETVAALL